MTNLWDRFNGSAMQSGTDPMKFLGDLDKVAVQMEASDFGVPPGMVESQFLRFLPKEFGAMVAVLRIGKPSRAQKESVVQGSYGSMPLRNCSVVVSTTVLRCVCHVLRGGCISTNRFVLMCSECGMTCSCRGKTRLVSCAWCNINHPCFVICT